MAKQKTLSNPLDIVGEAWGPYKILEYKGKTENKEKQNYDYWYDVECVFCGSKLLTSRKHLQTIKKKSTVCKVCHAKEIHKAVSQEGRKIGHTKAIEVCRHNDEPYKSNVSTGIKHYQVNAKRVRNQAYVSIFYQHLVSIMVDGKKYRLLQKQTSTSALDNEMIELANELNEILKNGGKEAFYEWYESFKSKGN